MEAALRTPPKHTRTGAGGSSQSALQTSSATPTGPNPQTQPQSDSVPMAPSTVPSVHTSAVSLGTSPALALSEGSHHRHQLPSKPATVAQTDYPTAAGLSNTSGGSPSKIAKTSVPSATTANAAAALAPVMGRMYGNSGGSRDSPSFPQRAPLAATASTESTPYSYLSRIVTPILHRERSGMGQPPFFLNRSATSDQPNDDSNGDSHERRGAGQRMSASPPSPTAATTAASIAPAPRANVDHSFRAESGEEAKSTVGMNTSYTEPSNAKSHAVDAAILEAADVAQDVYRAKLRGTLEGIMDALANELPRDHILLQLMADPTTVQYGKVRLIEIVEGFLYATQAQQYHNLVAETAQREMDNIALAARVTELERARREAEERALAQQHQQHSSPQLTRPAEEPRRLLFHKFTETTGGVDATTATDDDAASTRLPQRAQEHSSAEGVDTGLNTTNPMSEEDARRELMAILEATSREQELERCRRALAAPARLAEVVQGERQYGEKHAFVSDVVAELYKAVHAFMRYADGSLESLEALRNDLAVADERPVHQDSSGLSKDYPFSYHSYHSTPPQRYGQRGGGGVPDSDSASPTAVERTRIEALSEQLREAQVQTARALDRLRHQSEDQQRQIADLTRELTTARERDSMETAAATTEVRTMQREMQDMVREHERALTALRDETQQQVNDLQARLRTLQRERDEAQRANAAGTAQMEVLRQELAQIHSDDVQRQSETKNTTAALRSELNTCRTDLRVCEGELLCAQVEVCMSALEALYYESESAKYGLLHRSGLEGAARELAGAARSVQEELRHTKAQLDLAEAAALEREVAARGCMEELAGLLRGMWEDESIAAALQLVSEGGGAHTTTTSITPILDEALRVAVPQEKDRGDLNVSNVSAGPAAATSGATPWKVVQDAHRLPTTLSGLATALTYAYRNHRSRTQQWQDALQQARSGLAERDSRIRVLEANEATLKSLLQAEKEQTQRLRDELDAVTDASPMRELLARQDALLKAVSDERNALQKQWTALNADYMVLERRNGQLHERCAEKAHENAKLSGLLKLSGGGGGSPSSLFQTPLRSNNDDNSGYEARKDKSPSSASSKSGSAHDTRQPRHRWFADSIGATPESAFKAERWTRTPVTIERRSDADGTTVSDEYRATAESP